jgi:transcription elongation factor GreB
VEKTEKKRLNYITTSGFQKLRHELSYLLKDERPKLVKTVQWAASNGDRSENADYIYGKRRLREIDRRLRYLEKAIESAVVVNIAEQKNREKIFFGSTVTLEDDEGKESTYQIVGEDEFDAKKGKISWISPLGKALLGKKVDEEATVKRPKGDKTYTVIRIDYMERD